MKTLYHGSKDIVKVPVYGKGKQYNDYGLGFYCTEDLDLAMEWAVDLDRNGYANQYEIDETQLSILDLNDEHFTFLHWLAVLLENRRFTVNTPLAVEAKEYILHNFHVNYQDYDVIVGYRADDSYFAFAQDFLSGMISYRQLSNAMKFGNLGQQFVLKSKKAFSLLKYVDNHYADADTWFAQKESRDKLARREYFDAERNKRQRGDLYITQILDERMTTDDPRLR